MEEQIGEAISTHFLYIALVVLLLISTFFSASETAMMAINRYRLKHAAKTHPTARLVSKLLSRPDRLITTVLIGNSVANMSIAAVGTVIGMRAHGEIGALIATIVLTIIVLLFAEISPKIVANQKPELVAYLSAAPLTIMIKIFFPLIWIANALSNGVLFLMGVKHSKRTLDILTLDELRTVVTESESLITGRHKSMLSSILDLESITVNDIMIARAEIIGINLEESEASILDQIRNTQHTTLPIYRGDIDDIYGVVHLSYLAQYLTANNFSKSILQSLAETPYFVPEGTPLHTQLFNFQQNKNRFGLVVDEYGYIIGLITLANILEEIVGEITVDISSNSRVIPQPDHTYLVDGSTSIRLINQTLKWDLSTARSKTISGAIIEYLEMIPTANTCVLLNGYPIEIVMVQDNMIKTCKIGPKLNPQKNVE